MTFDQPTSVPGPGPDDLATAAQDGGPPASAPPGTAEAAPHDQLIARGGVLLKGTPTSIAAGDVLLLTTTAWAKVTDPAFLVTVTGTTPEKDPHGRRNTRVQLSGTDPIPASAKAAGYRLLRADPHRAPGQPPRRSHRHRPETACAGRAGQVPHRG